MIEVIISYTNENEDRVSYYSHIDNKALAELIRTVDQLAEESQDRAE